MSHSQWNIKHNVIANFTSEFRLESLDLSPFSVLQIYGFWLNLATWSIVYFMLLNDTSPF